MRHLSLLPILVGCTFFTSCASVYLTENTYKASSESTEINGADVKVAFKPMGGKSYGSFSAMLVALGAGTTDGPFLWRIEAEGQEGLHQKIWVNKITVTTSETKRSEPLPKEHISFSSEFKPMKGKENAGKTFANHQFPGKLEVYPKVDGDVSISADISVQSTRGVKRKTLNYTLSPDSSKGFDTIFIPTEIINSFGDDPTEWDW